MVPHCMCVLLAQMIHSYLTAMQSFISQLYNNSFHMTSGSAINKIKSKRKDLIKENDIKSSMESRKKYQYPILFFLFFFFFGSQSTKQLPQYLMKKSFASNRHLQNPFVCALAWQRLSWGGTVRGKGGMPHEVGLKNRLTDQTASS